MLRAACSAAVHYLSRSHGRASACERAPLSSCWSKARLILTTAPLPPWAGSWWQGCQHFSQCEGAGLYCTFPWHSRALLDTSNGSFPRFCISLCPFLACSLRAAALQPSIYMALIYLSFFGTYMAPIGPGPQCLPIFNIFIFTHADTQAYLWGQEVPLLLLYRWRTLNGNWLNWEQVVVGMEKGCLRVVPKLASHHQPQCSAGQEVPAHTRIL